MPRVRFQPLRINKRSWRNAWSSAEVQTHDQSPQDEEKRRSEEDDYEDYDGDSAGSSRTSSNSYSSEDAMLHRKPAIKTTASAYALRRQCNRYFTIILGSFLIVTVLILTQLHYHSARDVALGIHKPEPRPPPWEEFPVLKRYFGGLRSLEPISNNKPEYPGDDEEIVEDVIEALKNATQEPLDQKLAKAKRITTLQSMQLQLAIDVVQGVTPCFLDADKKVPVPSLHGYNGSTRGFPNPVLGSQDVLNSSEEMCFDRFGRLGPYGFGYSAKMGGIGAGLEGNREGAEAVWEKQREIDFTAINWAQTQAACARANNRTQPTADNATSNTLSTADQYTTPEVILVRTWSDYHYGQEDLLNLRALISEVALATGAQYRVHFLVEVRDQETQIWSDKESYDRALGESLPTEFQGMATLWSEQQMKLVYNGLDEATHNDQSVYSNERNGLLPVQYFAHENSQYEHIWNWELDVRYTGHLGELITRISDWSKSQPRKELWERNGRFYLPSEHGSWEDFKQMVRVQSEHGTSAKASIWSKAGGARLEQTEPAVIAAAEKQVWGSRRPVEDIGDVMADMEPPTSHAKDKYEWGVGQEADLITLNPIFDPDGTTLSSATNVNGYNLTSAFPPLRASLGRTMRLSRKLLETMHQETATKARAMNPELWPASVALHHGLKAVYVPQPVYVDRKWPTDYMAAIYNDGINEASGGARTSVWGDSRQHNLRGLSWGTRDSFFAEKLWRRWLGYRVDGKGGEAWETSEESEGRMCLPPMLLWPVRAVDLVID